MNRLRVARCNVSIVGAIAAVAAGTIGATPPEHANDNLTEIRVLSNRADLISGGDALVEILLPAKAKARPDQVRVDVDWSDVTSAFVVRADGRFYGLVNGLPNGESVLRAQVPNGLLVPGAARSLGSAGRGGLEARRPCGAARGMGSQSPLLRPLRHPDGAPDRGALPHLPPLRPAPLPPHLPRRHRAHRTWNDEPGHP